MTDSTARADAVDQAIDDLVAHAPLLCHDDHVQALIVAASELADHYRHVRSLV